MQCGSLRRAQRHRHDPFGNRRCGAQPDLAPRARQCRSCPARDAQRQDPEVAEDKPAIGLSMFGVTTQCVNQMTEAPSPAYDCLVFHATGTGALDGEAGRGERAEGLLDMTTTEVCDLLMDGIFSAGETRLTYWRTPIFPMWVLRALDMVNFAGPETLPDHYRQRLLHEHNPQITLMRTTVEENARMGRWIGEKLNRCRGHCASCCPKAGLGPRCPRPPLS
ncbi:hypothetical protein DSL92_02630 [Billgrantia gudaonensis]|uniref:UPF0261 domain-containing protein n=1 Tax=Billgrantia gudaonensis TaxID=376427 RepID=A0A3S0NF41_9GAMM|nr:hypothetical protein DSL92_02630 [Halomonas gudaonensis]